MSEQTLPKLLRGNDLLWVLAGDVGAGKSQIHPNPTVLGANGPSSGLGLCSSGCKSGGPQGGDGASLSAWEHPLPWASAFLASQSTAKVWVCLPVLCLSFPSL